MAHWLQQNWLLKPSAVCQNKPFARLPINWILKMLSSKKASIKKKKGSF